MPKTTTLRRNDRLLLAILVAGALLRLWQYAGSGSLWLDEIMLSRSILGLPLASLLTTALPYNQLAPKGFLLAEKMSTATMGSSDAALRLFPLAAALAALPIFAVVSGRVLSRAGALLASLMFATAVPLIHFGSLVKQYSSDVLISLLFLWLGLTLIDEALITSRRKWIAAVAGAVLVWFSQPSALVVGGVAAALLVFPQTRKQAAPIIFVWILSGVAAALAARAAVTPATGGMLREYWAEGFPPGNLAAFRSSWWPLDRLTFLFGTGRQGSLCYPFPSVYILLAVAGFGVLCKDERRTGFLLFAPFLVAVAAAIARQYPFSNRLILYLVPTFLIAIAAFIEWVRRKLTRISPPLAAASAALLVAPTIYPVVAAPPPYRLEDVRPLFSYLQSRRQPGDAIYVYYGAMHAVTYYGRRYGIRPTDYSIGRMHRGNNRCYLEDVDAFRPRRRVWVVITHPYTETRERDDIVHYLDATGVRRESFAVASRAAGRNPPPSEVFLYDLSPNPISGVRAETFPLIGPSPDHPVACTREGVPSMMLPKEIQPSGFRGQ